MPRTEAKRTPRTRPRELGGCRNQMGRAERFWMPITWGAILWGGVPWGAAVPPGSTPTPDPSQQGGEEESVATLLGVMAGLVPAIHALLAALAYERRGCP
jgi:hypothetical protein